MTFLDQLGRGIVILLAHRCIPVRWDWAWFLSTMMASLVLAGLLAWVMGLLAHARVPWAWLTIVRSR